MKHTKQNLTTIHSAFTLVELIVVIVILAILATIAFLSFGSQSSSARDSTRLSDLGSISKGLMVYQSNKGSYPTPDRGVNITNSGVSNIIGIQGEVGSSVKSNIKAGADGFVDPLNKAPYLYVINKAGNKYRLAGFLENKDSVALNLSDSNSVNAATYENRFIYLKGDNIAVLYVDTGSVITPIQDSTSIDKTAGIDISTGIVDELKAVNSNTVAAITATASLLLSAYIDSYPGCNTEDIKLSNGQIWAACNVGASKAYSGEVADDCGYGAVDDCNSGIRDIIGGLYQWGRNKNVAGAGISTGIHTSDDTPNFIVGSAADNDWITPQNDNLWGGEKSTLLGGTFSSLGSNALMRGPCEIGYHVPTIFEFCDAMKTIDSSYKCGDSMLNNALILKLKLPLAGYRTDSEGYYEDFARGRYHTSSVEGTSSKGFRISATGFDLISTIDRAEGGSIRCLKN